MKNRLFALLWVIPLWGSFAQSGTDTLKMSLQQCVDYALKNSTSVKNATLDEEIAAAKVREVRGIGLPQITGSAGLQHYFKLRRSFFEQNASNPLFNPRPTPQYVELNGQQLPVQQTPVPTLPDGTIIVFDNFFQLPSSLDASLNATQILFNSSYIVGLQAAKTYRELASRSAQQTREQTANNVKKAYYQNLINVERIKLFDVNIVRLDSSLRQLRALQKNGFTEQIEVDRLEVSLNNLMTEYEKTLNLLVLSSLTLKFQMGMPIEQNVILTDSISQYANNIEYNLEDKIDPKNRVEYQLLKLQVKSYQLDLKNNRGAALPSLVAQGTLGAFSQNTDLNFFDSKPYSINSSAPKNRTPVGYWTDYSYFQIGLNLPIFTGFQRTGKVQQSKLNLTKAENNLKNFEQAMNVQVQAAKVNLQNSQRSLAIQKRNMELAKSVSNNTFKKYRAGTGSNLEVTNAEASLKEAQINYFNALYDFLVYKIDYEVAAGLNKY